MNSSFSIVVIFAILGLGLFSTAVPLQEAFAGGPTVLSAKVTGPNQVTIVYSAGQATAETPAFDYSNLQLSGVGNRPVTNVFDNGDSDTHIITFGGDGVATDTTGAIDIAAFDTFGGQAGQVLTDGQGAEISNVVISSNNTDLS